MLSYTREVHSLTCQCANRDYEHGVDRQSTDDKDKFIRKPWGTLESS
jgi:hypothetical protein